MKRVVQRPYEDVLAAVPAALESEGFGVLTAIDVRETLKKKLDVDFRRYQILGACNPTLAHRALSADPDIGVMLPCNVVVYESEPGQTVVNAIDPMTTLAASDPRLRPIAEAVKDKLARALDRLSA